MAEDLQISQAVVPRSHLQPGTHNRILRLQAALGPLRVDHQATVDIQHHQQDPATLGEVRVGLTGASAGLADTGTLAMISSAARPRLA